MQLQNRFAEIDGQPLQQQKGEQQDAQQCEKKGLKLPVSLLKAGCDIITAFQKIGEVPNGDLTADQHDTGIVIGDNAIGLRIIQRMLFKQLFLPCRIQHGMLCIQQSILGLRLVHMTGNLLKIIH